MIPAKKLIRSSAHHEIGIPRAAFGTAQDPRPIRYGHSGAVLRNLGSDVGLGSFIV